MHLLFVVASLNACAAEPGQRGESADSSPVADPTVVSDPANVGTSPDKCTDQAESERRPPAGTSVELEQVGEFEGGHVLAATYPVPDDLGAPWSQWGEGVVLPDGRFVSGVGDHRGRDGRSWFYEYDPMTHALTRTSAVGPALGHEFGDWGYGKIHAPMLLDPCDRVVTSTYWGSRRDLELGGSYSGDHLIRYDPTVREVQSMGVPVEGYGLPSLSMSPDRSLVFAEAVDPNSDPDAGLLVVADSLTGEVLARDESDHHIGFRDVLVTPQGDALYAVPDGGLAGLDADGSPMEEPLALTDGWFRIATDPAPGGAVALASRRPEVLYRRDANGSYSSLGPLEEYVASLSLGPDGSTVYYVPGAHGGGYELGAPLMSVGIDTGERREIVRLNDLIEPALGVGVAGSFNVVADPRGDRVFVGLNGSTSAPDELFGEVVLAVVEFD